MDHFGIHQVKKKNGKATEMSMLSDVIFLSLLTRPLCFDCRLYSLCLFFKFRLNIIASRVYVECSILSFFLFFIFTVLYYTSFHYLPFMLDDYSKACIGHDIYLWQPIYTEARSSQAI